MKILGAIVSICLALYLFIEANSMGGFSLERIAYIAGGIILIIVPIFVFVPVKNDDQ